MINLSILKKKTPLLGFTVLQLFILFIVINAGTVAVVLSQRQEPEAQNTTNNLPSYEANTETTAQTANTTPQDTKQNNSSPQSTATSNKTTTTSNLPDQYGCIPQTSGYESCVTYAKKNALSAWCSEQSKKAGDLYIAQSAPAQAAYDAVMAEWNAVKDQPYYTHSPYNEYATDAKTKYNAIEKPAYATYVNTIDSLNAQGCNVIKTYTDTSWAGY
jgi:cytoskeletal protein RodZ